MLPVSAKKGVAHLRRYQQLSQEERYTITFLLVRRHSHAQIARELKRCPSTVCRELARNRNRHDNEYRAEVAHSYATARRRRERRGFHLLQYQWDQVICLLKEKWSPQQISNHLRRHASFTVSHETIYRYILQDKKRGGQLYRHLRIMPKVHRKRYNTRDSRGILSGKRHISTRPAAVETRKQKGHWEADVVMGSDLHHCILTFVERKTGLAIIRKLDSRTADAVSSSALQLLAYRASQFRTITFDNGTEFHGYKALEDRFPLKCYFATPYHSWERGSVENLNGLIRQYLPKGTSMRSLTQAHCNWIASKLNARPRKRHGYRSPQEVYYGKSQSLHFKVEPWALPIPNRTPGTADPLRLSWRESNRCLL
jgi:transposase, IS30 family